MSLPESTRGSQYSDVDRRHAVSLYLLHGVISKVAEITGIPEGTIGGWRRESDWWVVVEEELRAETTSKIRAKIDETIDKAFEQMQDRLVNGDYKVIDKRIERVPVSARDAGWIAAVMFDKRQVASNQPTSIQGQAVDSRIAGMLEQFEELGRHVQARTIEGEVVDKQPLSDKD